jgi:hypothetical protein
VIVGGTELGGIIVPDVVTCEPTTGFGTLPGGATRAPVIATIEPSACTIEPGGTAA